MSVRVAPSRTAVGVTAAAFAGHGVEEIAHAAERRTGDVEPGHAGALQGHHEPAGDRHVAVDARLIAPAALGRLDFDAVVDGLLGGVAVIVVVRHAEQFAERDRADRLGVELLIGADLVEELALLVHFLQQMAPAAADDGREGILGIAIGRVAGALEREQGHPGGGRVVVVARTAFVWAGETPLSGAELAVGEPAESERDGTFGLAGAAVGLEQRFLHAGSAASEPDADRGGHQGAGRGERIGGDLVGVGHADRIVDLRQVLGREDLVGQCEVVLVSGIHVQVVGQRDAGVFAVAGIEEQIVFDRRLKEEEAQHDQGRHVHDRAQEPGRSARRARR